MRNPENEIAVSFIYHPVINPTIPQSLVVLEIPIILVASFILM